MTPLVAITQRLSRRVNVAVASQFDPHPRTPAMAAGIEDHIWSCEHIAALLD
jgi:hypothetical protein